MNGYDHVLIASFIWGLILFRLLELIDLSPFFILFFIVGIVVGSLLPDLDANKSAIQYNKLIGKYARYFNWVTQYFNRPIAILTENMYGPIVNIVKKRYKNLDTSHRGFMHSPTAISYISICWLCIVLIIFILIKIIFKEYSFSIFVFPFALFIGALTHLMEDSFTKTGIRWKYPKDDKFVIRGNIITMSEYQAKKINITFFQRNYIATFYFFFASLLIFIFVVNFYLTILAVIGEIILGALIFKVKSSII